ncbi:GntR family transcriptional regulator [Paenarthrobacter sp. NPDC090522]|uniref:GntR family transcriptional regulator n=1 Tax=Paenarthrobacter sp. NPDC090522 TaxID=3364383 RepID=UPI003818611E
MSAEALSVMGRVTTRSRVDLVADELRNAIAAGSFIEGQRLSEIDLAARLGVSRGSVREAMQRLVQEGLIVVLPNKGMFVLEIEPEDIADIYDARRAVESAAALGLIGSSHDEVLEALEQECRLMSEAVAADDHTNLTAADQRFHEILVGSLRNSRLQKAAQTFMVETRLCLARLEGKYSAPQEAVDEHLEILRAIESASAEAVLKAVNVHMDNAIDLLSGSSASKSAMRA